jgi:hypothetical protein
MDVAGSAALHADRWAQYAEMQANQLRLLHLVAARCRHVDFEVLLDHPSHPLCAMAGLLEGLGTLALCHGPLAGVARMYQATLGDTLEGLTGGAAYLYWYADSGGRAAGPHGGDQGHKVPLADMHKKLCAVLPRQGWLQLQTRSQKMVAVGTDHTRQHLPPEQCRYRDDEPRPAYQLTFSHRAHCMEAYWMLRLAPTQHAGALEVRYEVHTSLAAALP